MMDRKYALPLAVPFSIINWKSPPVNKPVLPLIPSYVSRKALPVKARPLSLKTTMAARSQQRWVVKRSWVARRNSLYNLKQPTSELSKEKIVKGPPRGGPSNGT